MKVVVATKRVIDYHTKIRVKADGSGVETRNVKMSMNPFDEIALEAAIRLKEAGQVAEIIVISCGTTECQETLRLGLAMGADRAILIETSEELQPLAVAKILQTIVLKEQPQLVFLGKQAIDDDANQTGQMLAGLLNWPQGTFASQIKLSGDKIEVEREVDGGLEKVLLKLPAIVTADLRLNQPRFPSLPNIMKAKQKPLDVISAASLNVDIKPRLTTLKIASPPARKRGIKVSSINELLDKLHVTEKVL